MPKTVDPEMVPGVLKISFEDCREPEFYLRGMADIASRRPMRPDSVCWMASTGKMVAAIAFLMLKEEGKASLDDPAAKYLPHFRRMFRGIPDKNGGVQYVPVKNPITIRHLLSHTSGLGWLPGFFQNIELSYISLETQSHVYAASPLNFEPGTDWSYSNAGVNVVGHIIERISGRKYEEFVGERIFSPLSMKDTGYFLNEEQESRRAVGYAFDPETQGWIAHHLIPQMSLLPYSTPDRFTECGGGLFSTPADMLVFSRMLAGGGSWKGRRYLSEESLREMCTCQSPPNHARVYGLCSDVGMLGHGGAWGTSIQIDLEKKSGTLLMVQRVGEWPEWLIQGVVPSVGITEKHN